MGGRGRCPCGSGRTYPSCCGPVVAGEQPAFTAEALMRSRFTAFAEGRVDYLLHSWDPETRPAELTLSPDQQWVSLTILDTVDGAAPALHGTVEFIARFDGPTGAGSLQERSTFRRHDGRWVYVGGVISRRGLR